MNNNYYYVIESLMFCESGWTLMEKLVEQESDSNKNMDKCFKLGKNMKVHSLFFFYYITKVWALTVLLTYWLKKS